MGDVLFFVYKGIENNIYSIRNFRFFFKVKGRFVGFCESLGICVGLLRCLVGMVGCVYKVFSNSYIRFGVCSRVCILI